jgi:hypothetical protein
MDKKRPDSVPLLLLPFIPHPTTSFLTAANWIYDPQLELSGAGTRLFLQLILVGFFKSISFQSNTIALADIYCHCLQLCWFLKSPAFLGSSSHLSGSLSGIDYSFAMFCVSAKFKNWKKTVNQHNSEWIGEFVENSSIIFWRKGCWNSERNLLCSWVKIDFYLLFSIRLFSFVIETKIHLFTFSRWNIILDLR